jgi:hypothetical protein
MEKPKEKEFSFKLGVNEVIRQLKHVKESHSLIDNQ